MWRHLRCTPGQYNARAVEGLHALQGTLPPMSKKEQLALQLKQASSQLTSSSLNDWRTLVCPHSISGEGCGQGSSRRHTPLVGFCQLSTHLGHCHIFR